MLDKCRAVLAGTNGEYHYACPLDQRFLTFAGVDPDALKTEVAKGGGDGEILEWIRENAKSKSSEIEIAMFSDYAARRVPAEVDEREFFHGLHKAAGAHRDDIATWFDLLDLDDYVAFGGKA